MTTRTAERERFLNDVLDTAVFHNGYGFFYITGSSGGRVTPAERWIKIADGDDDKADPWTVTIDTIAAGIGVISHAEPRIDPKYPSDGKVLHNVKTGQRLYLAPHDRQTILEASRENDGGMIDVVLALAILECALFGAVVYG